MCLEPRIVLTDRPDIGGAHLEDVVLVTARATNNSTARLTTTACSADLNCKETTT